MALYRHPFLAEGFRLSYPDRLEVVEKLPLGDLPLEADLLLLRRDPAVLLPYPLQFLGARTLVEYKSPTDAADQAALEQLGIYGLLYVRREGLTRRDQLTLWLVASSFAANASQPGRAQVRNLRRVGPGVRFGLLDGFPTYLVDLRELPFTPHTVPLHMVSTGPRERELAEYLVGHRTRYPRQLEQLTHLHLFALAEVVMKHNLTPEQAGLTPEAAATVIALLRKWQPYDHTDAATIAREVLQRPDKEAVLGELLKSLSEDEVRRLIEARRTSPPPPAPPQD